MHEPSLRRSGVSFSCALPTQLDLTVAARTLHTAWLARAVADSAAFSPKDGERALNAPSELARRISAKVAATAAA